MQSLSKYNKGIKCLLCAIDLFSKCAWVAPIKDKKELVLLAHLKKQSQKETKQSPKDKGSQMKYGLTRVVNFKIILLKIF